MQCADVGATERQNTLGLQLFCSLNSVSIVNDRQRCVKAISALQTVHMFVTNVDNSYVCYFQMNQVYWVLSSYVGVCPIFECAQ